MEGKLYFLASNLQPKSPLIYSSMTCNLKSTEYLDLFINQKPPFNIFYYISNRDTFKVPVVKSFRCAESTKRQNGLLKKSLLKELTNQLLNIQVLFGYPVDVEFAIKNNKIYFLQVRPITKIMFSEMDKQWTTANFRDGGVSSRVCLTLMSSIYSTAFSESEREAYLKVKLLKPEEIDKELIKYLYGKLYMNMSINKVLLAKAPGFVERDFDKEWGIPIAYEGTGKTTKITFKYLRELPRIAINFQKTLDNQLKSNEKFNNEQIEKYKKFHAVDFSHKTLKETEKTWKEFLLNEFFINEKTYLTQFYLKTMKANDFRRICLKYMPYENYLNILSSIKNLSHARALKKECEIVNQMVSNNKTLEYWKNTSEEQILKDYTENKKQVHFEGINQYIEEYGHHSNRVLDLTVPPYSEDVASIITRFKNNIITDNLNELLKSEFEKSNVYEKVMQELKTNLPKRKFKSIEKQMIYMKKVIWWKEELKDLSNRYYALVKTYTKALAEKYHSAGILEDAMDIHYLKYTDIIDFIEKKISQKEIYKIINKNKIYCNSFINFKTPNDIDRNYNGKIPRGTKNILKGTGCSTGVKTGKVRVVKDLGDINKIQKGEILVTKSIDTGWISRFGILNGVVSEYGGILCHSSIMAREYEIPAIIGIENVENLFKDGEMIEIDGSSGEIRRI